MSSPRELGGRLVGVTGDPSDLAVLHSIVAGDGGTPGAVHTITIGFDAVNDLLAGRVAAATAFWNDEGVTLSRTGRGFHVFGSSNTAHPPIPSSFSARPPRNCIASALRARGRPFDR